MLTFFLNTGETIAHSFFWFDLLNREIISTVDSILMNENHVVIYKIKSETAALPLSMKKKRLFLLKILCYSRCFTILTYLVRKCSITYIRYFLGEYINSARNVYKRLNLWITFISSVDCLPLKWNIWQNSETIDAILCPELVILEFNWMNYWIWIFIPRVKPMCVFSGGLQKNIQKLKGQNILENKIHASIFAATERFSPGNDILPLGPTPTDLIIAWMSFSVSDSPSCFIVHLR